MTAIDALTHYLGAQPPGALQPATLVPLLAAAWDELEGSDEESTWSSKLRRIEAPSWDPPVLRFAVERHGAAMLGSKRAEVHWWAVNLSDRTATIERRQRRQIVPNDKRLNAEKLAEEIVALIEAGAGDPRLIWSQDRSSVRLEIGQVIPTTNRETTANRRKRFAASLYTRTSKQGWAEGKGWYTFVLKSD